MNASPQQVASALQSAESMMLCTGSVGCTHREEHVIVPGEKVETVVVARVDRKGQYHVQATQSTHEGTSLAAKLKRESFYTVATTGTGRPGWVRLLDHTGKVVHDEHRDSRIVSHYTKLGLLNDPHGLLTAPDSSD